LEKAFNYYNYAVSLKVLLKNIQIAQMFVLSPFCLLL